MRNMRRIGSGLMLFLATVFILSPPAAADGGPSVAKGVPDDVFLYIGWMHNPERAYLEKYWDEVWAEFEASGIVNDLKRFVMEMLPQEGQQQVESSMAMAEDLLGSVDWKGMFEKDGSWSMTMGPMGPHYLLVLETDPAKTEGIVSGLAKILETFSGFAEEIQFTTTVEENGPTVHALTIQGGAVPFGGFVGKLADRIVLSTSRDLLDRSLGLLQAEGTGGSILEHPKFRAARGRLPVAEDMISFFDCSRMLAEMKGLFARIPQGEIDEEGGQVLGMMGRVLDDADMVDYVVSVEYTEGYRNLTATLAQMREDADQKPLWEVFGHQQPFRDFHRYVPKDATSFSLSAGIDLAALYRYMVGLFGKIPGAEQMLARWDEIQKSVLGMNVHDDLLAKISGETISVTFPAATPSPFGGGDASVMMMRVRDTEALADRVEGWMKNVAEMASERGFPLTIQSTDVVEGGRFHKIQFAMMPFVQPVLGFHGDQFVFGTDAAAIQKVAAVADRPEDTILRNPRFMAVGLLPYSEVSAISYKNLEKSYQAMAQTLQGIGMAMTMMSGMLAAQMPKDGPNEQIMKIVTKVTEMLPKLAPVVAKIDFYRDSVSFTYFDAKAKASVTRSATTIRPPGESE
jgi:hypothetical protein